LHILSYQRRSEFLSGGSVVRFEMTTSGEASRPTLYIKSNIIDLYFTTKNPKLSLDVINPSEDLYIYIIGIDEGSDTPFFCYSAIESLSEKQALEMVLSGVEFDVFLFNDFAIEIARSEGICSSSRKDQPSFEGFSPRGPDYHGGNHQFMSNAVAEYAATVDEYSHTISMGGFVHDANSQIISGSGDIMKIKGFSNFTEVHEMLPQIVGDHTFLKFIHSPDVLVSPGNEREFSDAMIVGESALLSLQAKCFDFDGDVLPSTRENAEKRMRKNVRKAIEQTRGSSRMIHEGKVISHKSIYLDLSVISDFIFGIFIPSLDLISDDLSHELSTLSDVLRKRGHNLVVLDPMQFLRTVQASAGAGFQNETTPDELFFRLLGDNSRQAHGSGRFNTPILYRW
jgi:hypothetical protein